MPWMWLDRFTCLVSWPTLGSNPRSKVFWQPVVERCRKKLVTWKEDYLLLSKNSADKNHYDISLSITFLFSRSLRELLLSLSNRNEMGSVCWNRSEGGLGFGKVAPHNIAMLAEWLWRFPRESKVVWARVIRSLYGTAANGGTYWRNLEACYGVLGSLY